MRKFTLPAGNMARLATKAATSAKRAPSLLYFGLILVFIFEYMRPANYLPALNAIKINTLIPISFFALTLLKQPLPGAVVLRDQNTKKLLFLLFLLTVSIFTARVTYNSYFEFKRVLGYCIIFFLIVSVVDNPKRISGVFTVLALIHILLAILNPNIILQPESRSYIQNVTFLGDGNDFGLSVCIALPFALFLLQESSGTVKRVFFSAIILLLILCIIGTSSRGASIGLAFVLLYLWAKSRRKILGVALLSVIITSIFIYAPPAYFDRMETITAYDEGSAKGRLRAWGSAIRMAVDNPVLGVGAGHFPISYGTEYRPPGVGRTEIPWATAHSIYFLLLGELGFPGLFFLLTIIIGNLRRNEKRLKLLEKDTSREALSEKRLIIALNAGMIAFATAGAFLSAAYYPHLYVISGLFSAYHLRKDSFFQKTAIK